MCCFPDCEVSLQGEVVSLEPGSSPDITSEKRFDAGYIQVEVPATRKPDRDHAIVGGGKTAMDAVL